MTRPALQILLRPASWIYGALTGIRNLLFDFHILREKEFPVFLFVVGNLSVGGSGKTPHVMAFARELQKHYRVAILSRGYKRKSSGFRWVEADDDPILSGDEPLEIKTRLRDIPVACDGNRRRGIEEILKQLDPAPEIILLDDGFQHRYIKADYSLLLTPLNQLFSQDLMLPAGRLREAISGAKRATGICITGCRDKDTFSLAKTELPIYPGQSIYASYPAYRIVQSHQIEEGEILLICSIANPDSILLHLQSLGHKVHVLRFKDHHAYKETDIQKIIRTFNTLPKPGRKMITTGKDWVKLKQFDALVGLPLSVLEIDIVFHDKGMDEIIEYVRTAIEEDQRKY